MDLSSLQNIVICVRKSTIVHVFGADDELATEAKYGVGTVGKTLKYVWFQKKEMAKDFKWQVDRSIVLSHPSYPCDMEVLSLSEIELKEMKESTKRE